MILSCDYLDITSSSVSLLGTMCFQTLIHFIFAAAAFSRYSSFTDEELDLSEGAEACSRSL